jgi:predicted transcriptional regulator
MTFWYQLVAGLRSLVPLGPLERRVLDALWQRSDPATVRDLQSSFLQIAYTTLMTTLDRLWRKGVLVRARRGRAFLYSPRLTSAELDAALAADTIRKVVNGHGLALRPLLSFFVEAIDHQDHQLLDELEELVRARRAARQDKQ